MSTQTTTNRIAGWPIVGWSSLVVVTMTLAILATRGSGEEGLRATIQATAKTSFILFISAFIASALNRLWPTPLSRWMLTNRRYLGVSFAVSHSVHLAAIVTLAYRLGDKFEVSAATLLGGGLGYVFIIAMTATSFDRTAAWVGRRAWRTLHTTGVYIIWFIFFATYLPQATRSLVYAPYPVLLLAAVGLRGFAGLQRRRRLALAE